MQTDVAIADFLGSLGLRGPDAELARAVLEADGITNPRKTRLSAAKLERARAAIDARFARFCASCAERTDAGGREVVLVPAAVCTRCGGSSGRSTAVWSCGSSTEPSGARAPRRGAISSGPTSW